MSKVLVTGSKGFIGRNLVTALKRHDELAVEEFDSSMTADNLAAMLPGCKVVYHLAGVNRPENETDFESVNKGLTQTLVDLLSQSDDKPLIVFSSSTQAQIDNPYGRSKKAAEDVLCLLYTSPSPRDQRGSRMPSSA